MEACSTRPEGPIPANTAHGALIMPARDRHVGARRSVARDKLRCKGTVLEHLRENYRIHPCISRTQALP